MAKATLINLAQTEREKWRALFDHLYNEFTMRRVEKCWQSVQQSDYEKASPELRQEIITALTKAGLECEERHLRFDQRHSDGGYEARIIPIAINSGTDTYKFKFDFVANSYNDRKDETILPDDILLKDSVKSVYGKAVRAITKSHKERRNALEEEKKQRHQALDKIMKEAPAVFDSNSPQVQDNFIERAAQNIGVSLEIRNEKLLSKLDPAHVGGLQRLHDETDPGTQITGYGLSVGENTQNIVCHLQAWFGALIDQKYEKAIQAIDKRIETVQSLSESVESPSKLVARR